MPAPIIPWEPSNIPEEIQSELNRRKGVRGLNYINNGLDLGWDSSTGDWNQYKGPMTSWVRVCSNGYGLSGSLDQVKPGFVLYGGRGFYNIYGFDSSTELSGQSIIGYTPRGVPHVIENDLNVSDYPIHVPIPQISKITSTIQKELFRRVSIEWTCFSSKQLEYMTPYFLVPGISVIIEWGWNHFNRDSLVDLSDEKKLKDLFNNPYPLYTDNILNSRGNYEVTFGIITNFEWAIDGNKIHAVTEVTSKDRIYAGLVVNARAVEQSEEDDNNATKITNISSDFRKTINTQIEEFKSFVTGSNIVPGAVPSSIQDVSHYILRKYNKNFDKWQECIRGIFYGRDETERRLSLGQSELSTLERAYKTGNPRPDNVVPTSTLARAYTAANRKSTPNQFNYINTEDDFDGKTDKEGFWINMGLVVEIMNYHSSTLKIVKNQQFFRIDIDDCVISGHPNLISTDGSILLIPNAEAPKYFYGHYGIMKIYERVSGESFFDFLRYLQAIEENVFFGFRVATRTGLNTLANAAQFFPQAVTKFGTAVSKAVSETEEEFLNIGVIQQREKEFQSKLSEKASKELKKELDFYNEMGTSDVIISFEGKNRKDAEKIQKLPDWRLMKVCGMPYAKVYRDNIDVEINKNRYPFANPDSTFEFPFYDDHKVIINGKENIYPKRYCGLLKNLYINSNVLKSAVNNQDNKTFVDIYNEIFRKIQDAAGGIWDLRIVNGDGKLGDSPDNPATMKIVDYNFTGLSINYGNVYHFDYYDSDSILQSVAFKPTLSNAQAIRTIYSQTNNPDKKRKFIQSERAQLLDYKFKDRLFLDESPKDRVDEASVKAFIDEMARLQSRKQIIPTSMQMTTLKDGKPFIKRLVLPDDAILNLILDDGDKDNNPRYTGIMPGIQAEFTLQGIGGVRTFQMFLVRNLPKPYSHEDVVFRIIDVTQQLEDGKWTTIVKAGLIPLREQIKRRLGIISGTN